MITEIELAKIIRNPDQPRESFPTDHIERLADSIKMRGLIQPITVKAIASDQYMIITGECRYRAHQLLKTDKIRAEIVEIDDKEMQLRAIVENLQRRDMNPIEEAKAFQSLIDNGYSITQIVQELGLKSPAIVRQRLDLLALTDDIAKLVASGQLNVAMAWGVAQVSAQHQNSMIRAIASGRLKTAEQVRHAGIAMREAEKQQDAFDSLPIASPKDIAAINRLESKIETIITMVSLGFKDGECTAAQRVSPDRVNSMIEKLKLIRNHIQIMEHDLRRVAAQTEIRLEMAL